MEKINNNKKPTAFIVSTHNTGLAIIRALGIMGIEIIALYYDKRDMGYVSKYVSQSKKIPHPEKTTESFILSLLDITKDFKKSILIPADDFCLNAISKHKKILEQNLIVACPDWSVIQNIINKENTYRIAKKIGVDIPKTLFPSTKDEVLDFCKIVDYPCLVKPQISHLYYEIFKQKLVKVFNKNELIKAYENAINSGLTVMIQEYIPGDDSQGFNYNSYNWDQNFLVEFTAQKVRMSPPDSGVPRVVMSKKVPEILEIGRKILKSFNYNGYSCIEFKYDNRDGKYKLLEVNGRHNRSSLLALKCGINFPFIEYENLILKNKSMKLDYLENIFWIDLAKDLSTSLHYAFRENVSITDFLKPYFNDHIFAVWDFRDLKPFTKRCFEILKIILLLMTKLFRKEGISNEK